VQPNGGNSPDSPSALAACLQALVSDGRAAVSANPPGTNDDDALPILEQFDKDARAELGLELPVYSVNAALWGARMFHHLCRFLICRDIPAEIVTATAGVTCSEPRNPSTDWSVDLTLRHLPALHRLASHLSSGDPLVTLIHDLGATYPLSSVGIPELKPKSIDSFVGSHGLLRLYADRIIAANDLSRLGDPRLDDLIRADLGAFRDLAPAIASRLFQTANDTH